MYKTNKTGTYVDYALQDTASQKFLRKEAGKLHEGGTTRKLREAQARERADRQKQAKAVRDQQTQEKNDGPHLGYRGGHPGSDSCIA